MTPMTAQITWHGTEQEQEALEMAVRRNCTCDPDGHVTCPPHRMLDEDQHALDRLVFVRRMLAEHLWQEETNIEKGN